MSTTLQDTQQRLKHARAAAEGRRESGSEQERFIFAAMQGNLPLVQGALSRGIVDPNGVDEESMTALHWAAAYNESRVLSCLLADSRVKANASNKRGHTPLHQAAMNGSSATMRLLLAEKEVDVDARNEWDETALMLSVAAGEAELVQMLLQHGADASLRDKWGQTIEDIGRGHGGVSMEKLKGDRREETPVTRKTAGGKRVLSKLLEAPLSETDFMEWLEEEDMDVNGRDMYKWTALHKVASWNKASCLASLLASEKLADAMPQGMGGDTPLHAALEMGAAQCVEVLLSDSRVQEKLNTRNDAGMTCLHAAVMSGDKEAVQRMIELGADVMATRNGDGKTAWHLASENKLTDLANLIWNAADEDQRGSCLRPSIAEAPTPRVSPAVASISPRKLNLSKFSGLQNALGGTKPNK